jgi:F-type H+-transporting ATPase subunit b
MLYQPFTQFGESSDGIGALGVSGQAFLIQLLTFVVVFLILRKYAFKPIVKVMEQRRELIESGVQLGEDMRKERAELDARVERELQDARKKADGIISDSQTTARQITADAETKANAKADVILKEAEGRIQQDTARARKQLEKELVGLISEATEAIIDEKVDAKKDAALLDQALKGRA